jgi:TetR/AcrR family transcriptional regulator, cholesterol catabolism regulator
MTKAEDTKENIIKQAAHCFRKKGYAASTLREIAKRSRIEQGSIYFHFGSKQDILLSIMKEVMSELTGRVKKTLVNQNSPLDKLHAAIVTHIKYHIENLDKTYSADSEIRSLTKDNYIKIIEERRLYENMFISILNDGVKKGVFRELDVKMTSFSILQMCTGVSYWFKEGETLSIDEIAERYFSFICGGVINNVPK